MKGSALPSWLATLGVGAAIGAAVVMLQGLMKKQIDEDRRLRDPARALPSVAVEIEKSADRPSIALITGASPGTMGGCIAETLASLGCQIAAVEHPLRRSQCEELCQQLVAQYGVRAVPLTADATDEAQVEDAFIAAVAQLQAEPNIVVSTVGGGGVAADGTTRNGGTDIEGRPRVELAHEG